MCKGRMQVQQSAHVGKNKLKRVFYDEEGVSFFQSLAQLDCNKYILKMPYFLTRRKKLNSNGTFLKSITEKSNHKLYCHILANQFIIKLIKTYFLSRIT